MIFALLSSAAFAGGFNFGFVAGPTVGGGEGRYGGWMTASPTLGATMTLRLAFIEAWGGISASGLRLGDDPARLEGSLVAPLGVQAGVGFGGNAFSAGIYGGPTPQAIETGVYARLNLPPSAEVRYGVEFRGSNYHLEGYDLGAVSLLFRVEAGGGKKKERRGPPPGYRPPPPPHGPPPPPPYAAPPPEAEGEGEAAPIDHDAPY